MIFRYRDRDGERVELPPPLTYSLGRVVHGTPTKRTHGPLLMGPSGHEISLNIPVNGQWLTVFIDPATLTFAIAGGARNGERGAAIDAAKAVLYDVTDRLRARSARND